MSSNKKRSSFPNYKVKLRLINERGKRCEYCGLRTDYLELDHIIPLWNDGSHNDSNLQLLCADCHREKSRADQVAYNTQHPVVVIRDGVVVPGKGKYNGGI